MECLNAVVITNLGGNSSAPTYRVISQVGYESVVRPDDPTAVAEVRTVGRGTGGNLVGEVTLTRSSLSNGEPLWTGDQFTALMRTVFDVHDHFATTVYQDAGIQLDLEVKLTADDRIMVKQVRPFIKGAR